MPLPAAAYTAGSAAVGGRLAGTAPPSSHAVHATTASPSYTDALPAAGKSPPPARAVANPLSAMRATSSTGGTRPAAAVVTAGGAGAGPVDCDDDGYSPAACSRASTPCLDTAVASTAMSARVLRSSSATTVVAAPPGRSATPPAAARAARWRGVNSAYAPAAPAPGAGGAVGSVAMATRWCAVPSVASPPPSLPATTPARKALYAATATCATAALASWRAGSAVARPDVLLATPAAAGGGGGGAGVCASATTHACSVAAVRATTAAY